MKEYKNSAYKQDERLLLERAINALKKATGIDARIIQMEGIHRDPTRADATIDVDLAGVTFRYTVEIKRVDRFAAIAQIKNQFDTYETPGLLVTPRITKQSAEKCRELNVQFIDTNGNAFLHAPGSYVFVQGMQSTEPDDFPDTRKTRFRSGTATGLKVIFALLCKPELINVAYREIAKVAGVAYGNMGWILDDLNARGFTTGDKNKANYRILERKRLVDEWVTNYPIKLRQKLNPKRFHAIDSNWWKQVDITKYGALWGGEIAADKFTNNLRPSTVTIYMHPENLHQNISKLVTENKLRGAPDGEIEILETFWNFSKDTAVFDAVPPLLVYADLLATMDPRNFEIASMIYEQEIHGLTNIN